MSFDKRLEDAASLKASKPREKHPTGYEPGIDTGAGTIVYRTSAKPNEVSHDWAFILEDYGLDPEAFTVMEPVQVRSWDANMGEGNVQRFYYYRASIVSKGDEADFHTQIESLSESIRKWKPPAKPKLPKAAEGPPRAFVVTLSDWQIGKRDGDGVSGVLHRLELLRGEVLERVAVLRRSGVNVASLVVLGMGDLVEGCVGFYPQQTYTVEANHRQQIRLGYEALTGLLKAWVPEFPSTIVAGVGGNHGEYRMDGKSYTDFADNMDLQVIEIAAKVINENPELEGRIKWLIPEHSLSLSLEAEGTILGVAHGHQGGRNPGQSFEAAAKARKWWREQSFGRRNVADADVLVTAHFHYFDLQETSYHRTHVQCPALDGGSDWFAEAKGAEPQPGVLTFTVGYDPEVDGDNHRHLQNIAILAREWHPEHVEFYDHSTQIQEGVR